MSYTPRILERYLHVGQTVNGTWHNGVTRYYNTFNPKGIFIHIQEGYNYGSFQHFHAVTASCTVMIARNGDIWLTVPENKGPWTQGDVCSPTAKGVRALNQYGWDPNYWGLSIELEGFTGDNHTAEQKASLLWQVQTWMKRYGISKDNIFRHADVNQCSRPKCPGDVIFNWLLSQLGSTPSVTPSLPAPNVYVKPDLPIINGKPWDGLKNVEVNGVKFNADKRSNVEVSSSALNRRQWASTASEMTGPSMPKGTKFNVLGWVTGEKVDGENRWWVGDSGSRLWVGATVQKPKAAAPAPKPQDPPKPDNSDKGASGSPVVRNGILFYPLGPDGKGRDVNVIANGNLRPWAGTGESVIGTVKAGDVIRVAYWCRGESVDGENIWYILDRGEKDVIQSGARIWSPLTSSRPY